MHPFGTHVLPTPPTVRLGFGALSLEVEARADEWRIVARHAEERFEVAFELGVALEPGGTVSRVATDATDRTLSLEPLLPSEDVVMRTEPPIAVLPGADLTVYVGTPLWVGLKNSLGQTLAEVSSVRMQRTWFGPTVRDGALCLATRSSARLSLADVPHRPHRAWTVLSVKNEGALPFTLERLKLPMPHLGIWQSATGVFWTECVNVVRRSGDDTFRLSIEPGPPALAADVQRVGEPRRTDPPNPVLRALDALFSDSR